MKITLEAAPGESGLGADQAGGTGRVGDGHVDFSFRAPEHWLNAPSSASARVGKLPVNSSALVLGDDEVGPVLMFFRLDAGINPPNAPRHGHASDNFRISLLGELPMGRESYGPGQFRLQQGWAPYASDNYAQGPEGGWTALMFADQRGTRVRPVPADGPELTDANAKVAEWIGIRGDLVSTEPADQPGPSAMVTTLDGVRKAAHINADFEGADDWLAVGEHARAVAALMGDPEKGPFMLLATVSPGGRALSSCACDTEVFRLVVRGSCTIGADRYEAGDMRVDVAGGRFGDVVAGPDGLDEVVVVADRRAIVAGAIDDDLWGPWVSQTVATLRDGLDDAMARLPQPH